MTTTITILATTAPVADRPTEAGPAPVRNPRWQPIAAMVAMGALGPHEARDEVGGVAILPEQVEAALRGKVQLRRKLCPDIDDCVRPGRAAIAGIRSEDVVLVGIQKALGRVTVDLQVEVARALRGRRGATCAEH